MKKLWLFFFLCGASFSCEEPCDSTIDFKKLRSDLLVQLPQMMAEPTSLSLVGAHGVHWDKDLVRAYGYFAEKKMVALYTLNCEEPNEVSLKKVEMTSTPDKNLVAAISELFLWAKGYPEILDLLVSKSAMEGNHWLILIKLPGDKGNAPWWLFSELIIDGNATQIASAFAYPVIP